MADPRDQRHLDLETLYQDIVAIHAEPDVACALGSALKYMSRQLGRPLTHDSRGNLIEDDRWYWFSAAGIIPVEPGDDDGGDGEAPC